MIFPSAAATAHKLLIGSCSYLTCFALNLKADLFYIHTTLYEEVYTQEYGVLVALNRQLIRHVKVNAAATDKKENFGLVTEYKW